MTDQIVLKLKEQAETGVVRDHRDPEVVAYAARCTIDAGVGPEKAARFQYTRSIESSLHSYHLSLCFRKAPYTDVAPFDHRFAKRAVPQFFGEGLKHVLVYRPRFGDAKRWQIWYFRLFTDQDWKPSGYMPPRAADDLTWFDWTEYALMRFGW